MDDVMSAAQPGGVVRICVVVSLSARYWFATTLIDPSAWRDGTRVIVLANLLAAMDCVLRQPPPLPPVTPHPAHAAAHATALPPSPGRDNVGVTTTRMRVPNADLSILLRGSGLVVCTRHPSSARLEDVTAVTQLPPVFAHRRMALVRFFAEAPAAAVRQLDAEGDANADGDGCGRGDKQGSSSSSSSCGVRPGGSRYSGRELHDSKLEDNPTCGANGERDLFNMRCVVRRASCVVRRATCVVFWCGCGCAPHSCGFFVRDVWRF